jgi:hypothetical protein
MRYTEIEGAFHAIAEDEHTECGLVIPFLNTWTEEPDGDVHCGPDAKPEKAEKPKRERKKK